MSKTTYFIPTYIIVSTERVARFFLHYVQKLYNLLCIILDYRLQFVTLFTRELYYLLRVKVILSTTQYLQTNRQTKQVNLKLNQYIWLFVSKRQDYQHDLTSFYYSLFDILILTSSPSSIIFLYQLQQSKVLNVNI